MSLLLLLKPKAGKAVRLPRRGPLVQRLATVLDDDEDLIPVLVAIAER